MKFRLIILLVALAAALEGCAAAQTAAYCITHSAASN